MKEFKYLGCDDRGTDVFECKSKLLNQRKVSGTIRVLVNTKQVLHESIMILTLMYGKEIFLIDECKAAFTPNDKIHVCRS